MMLHDSLFRPCDPSLLAFVRICFGICMMIDIPQERGLSRADTIFGDDLSAPCTFPLIHGMKPFTQDIMIVLYALMFLNALFFTAGYFYRLNIISFTIIYWYIFTLNTSVWNNHSYLYGLIAILFSVTNAHHFLSVDGILCEDKYNTDVPLWNYALFRFQVFIVYFYAGLKKTEADWLTGYSMSNISREWVFDPLRVFLSNEDIDYYIVHICGFLYDISVGFLLFFDKTRIIGLVLCASFHGLNSMIFSIGMFPYVMFASSFIFCDPSFFKVLLSKIPVLKWRMNTSPSNPNKDCMYEIKKTEHKQEEGAPRLRWSQISILLFCTFYMTSQAFLPYSHFITKGYNGWTPGLYGYSWDMMVHSFKNQHVKISYKTVKGDYTGYLKPQVFLRGKSSRWTNNPGMAHQYAVCIRQELEKLGIQNASVYFDVWKSMNKRFQQRMFDPEIDIAGYPWSPFKEPSFVKPLLSNLSDWREELKRIKTNLKNMTKEYKVVFIADFPGLYLENYVSNDLGNASIHVLRGKIRIEKNGTDDISLDVGGVYQVEPGEFHRVFTVSDEPSCYYYIYMNKTVKSLKEQMSRYENWLFEKERAGPEDDSDIPEIRQEAISLFHKEQNYLKSSRNITRWRMMTRFVTKKIGIFRRSYLLFWSALRNLLLGKPTVKVLAYETEHLDLWMKERSEYDSFQAEVKADDKTEL